MCILEQPCTIAAKSYSISTRKSNDRTLPFTISLTVRRFSLMSPSRTPGKEFCFWGSAEAGYAACQKKSKDRKYLQETLDLGHLFRPMAFEVFGYWGEGTRATVAQASRRASSILKINPSQFASQWKNGIAVSLQKENANIILNKIAAIHIAEGTSLNGWNPHSAS
eukprot:m.38457 g.38457  ORF g.38457 m.38457 type:complete len:166 (+) comp32586_c0_seq2:216-713(+)